VYRFESLKVILQYKPLYVHLSVVYLESSKFFFVVFVSRIRIVMVFLLVLYVSYLMCSMLPKLQ
jgi:hypothetical protein